MSLFRRKSKEEPASSLSELPTLPNTPMFPDMQKSGLNLPENKKLTLESSKQQFPILSSSGKNLNNAIVREIDNQEDEEIRPYFPKKPAAIEMDQERKSQSHPAQFSSKPMFIQKQDFKQQNKEPIFVRVDKYKTAIGKIQETKHKLMEIERLLGNIRELRMKEEMELQEWNREIQSAKAKIDSADKMLFSDF